MNGSNQGLIRQRGPANIVWSGPDECGPTWRRELFGAGRTMELVRAEQCNSCRRRSVAVSRQRDGATVGWPLELAKTIRHTMALGRISLIAVVW